MSRYKKVWKIVKRPPIKLIRDIEKETTGG
jgi:hypothetical protein